MKIKAPYAQLTVLQLFVAGELKLNAAQFDKAFDAITDFLGDVNNNRYKLTDSPAEDDANGI